MYEIIVSAEFERWFESLDETAAERVAAALELLRATGPELDPVRQSRLLLWYDGVGSDEEALQERLARRFQAAPQAWGHLLESARELMSWQREAVRCLESELFRDTLAGLDAPLAAAVLREVEELRRVWRGAWALIHSAGLSRYRTAALQAYGTQVAPTRDAFLALVARVGLDPKRLVDTVSGLRELSIVELSPRLRILYAFETSSRRLLALLGEPLTRRYYGDSVRLAEKLWREHQATRATELATP